VRLSGMAYILIVNTQADLFRGSSEWLSRRDIVLRRWCQLQELRNGCHAARVA
jgi:hypothetical protein